MTAAAHKSAEEEPEPEVDLSKLRERMRTLDVNARSQAEGYHEAEGEDDAGEVDEEAFHIPKNEPRRALKLHLNPAELEEMKREKEEADAARGM